MQRIQPTTIRPKLVLCCGLPGSGKTTLGRKLEKELPAIRLCLDEWKASLGMDFFDEAGTLLEARLWKLGCELLQCGQNIIIEDGLWSRAERDEKRSDVAKLGIEIDTDLHYFDVPFEELIRRLEIRNVSGGFGTVPLTREQMEGCVKRFQAPDETELALFANSVIHRS